MDDVRRRNKAKASFAFVRDPRRTKVKCVTANKLHCFRHAECVDVLKLTTEDMREELGISALSVRKALTTAIRAHTKGGA